MANLPNSPVHSLHVKIDRLAILATAKRYDRAHGSINRNAPIIQFKLWLIGS